MTGFASSRAFRTRHTLVISAVTVPAACIVALYLAALLQMSREQWLEFGLGAGVIALAVGILGQWVQRRFDAPVARCIERDAQGLAEEEDWRAAYAAASRLPSRDVLWSTSNWLLAGIFIPLWMDLRLGHLRLFTAGVIAVASLSGALATSTFLLMAVQRLLRPLREVCVSQIPDPRVRSQLVLRVSLARKFAVPMVLISSLAVFFAVLMAYVMSNRPVEVHDARIKAAFLGQVAEQMRGDRLPPLEPLRTLAARSLIADELLVLDRESGALLEGRPGSLDPEEVQWILRSSRGPSGDGTGLQSRNSFAWLDLGARPGRILVAVTPWSRIAPEHGHSSAIFAGLFAAVLAISLALARLIAREVTRTSGQLKAQAERITRGDLRGHWGVEADDELGDLARSFEHMATNLRTTIARVSATAERVDAAVAELAQVGADVSGATLDQRRGIEQATESMASINRQVAGITESAQLLNGNVEEASSSVLELGAAGEELNQTAAALNAQVEEVGSSIEQMVRSVSQIGSSTENLAQAASETASSMAEMASSMREVEANAGETASLSSQVVKLAETGRERVQQTIVGMDAIRDATDSAGTVIRGLAGRVKEIGAIVGVIDDVADETNLLALNASIIAAQAGDRGRAFSVVADEIKDLADRVLSSTQEIATLIRAVQGETHNATRAIERGIERVQSGVDLSAEAGLALEEITSATRDSGSRIAEIVAAVREQAQATAHVSELSERVASQVEEIRQAGKEQERGNEVVMRGSVVMRDVAQQTHRTTQEQARGAARIRDSMESVRDAVDQIQAALQRQSDACHSAVRFLEAVFGRTRSNQASTQRLEGASRKLAEQAEALRADVRRFQLQ